MQGFLAIAPVLLSLFALSIALYLCFYNRLPVIQEALINRIANLIMGFSPVIR